MIDDLLSARLESSVGGERPKLLVGTADGASLIVKFTPSLNDPFGPRWRDLLRVEALAAQTLRTAGIDAVKSRYVEVEDRGYLEIERFDRVKPTRPFFGSGRVGHVTLFNLGMALYGEASNPEVVIAGLVRDGHLPPEDAARFARQHAFSRAIANTDTHLGNYGLLIDDDGNARLSPAYDVLPMAFAPKHDELPDRLVQHTGPRDAATDELVQRLIAAVEAEQGITREFREAWLRAVG
ncbi:MAG TPA: HipA domain-containing protein [Myxococcales bacterium]